MIVLNVNRTNTLFKNFKQQKYQPFQKMLQILITKYLWIQKDLKIHHQNNTSYIHVIVDAFSHFVVTVPVKQNNAQNAVNSLLHHWITKFGPPIYLVTDRGSEYINSEFANLCTTMGIRHSPKSPKIQGQMV